MNSYILLLSELITFRTLNGFVVTKVQDIIRCEADGNYAVVHLDGGQQFLSACNLKAIEEMLPEEIILRVHRSTLVSKLHVRRFVANGKLTLYLSDGKKVEVSSRKRNYVREKFELD